MSDKTIELFAGDMLHDKFMSIPSKYIVVARYYDYAHVMCIDSYDPEKIGKLMVWDAKDCGMCIKVGQCDPTIARTLYSKPGTNIATTKAKGDKYENNLCPKPFGTSKLFTAK